MRSFLMFGGNLTKVGKRRDFDRREGLSKRRDFNRREERREREGAGIVSSDGRSSSTNR